MPSALLPKLIVLSKREGEDGNFGAVNLIAL
jgi:hypothetical protein